MARPKDINAFEADYVKVFATLHCPVDKEETRHSQQRVIAHWAGHWQGDWHILVRCSKCRLVHLVYTNEIPPGMQPYHVRIIAHGGVVPGIETEVPSLSEEFTILAANRQAALRQSSFTSSMPLRGQMTETLIDGVEERDERF